MKEREERLRDDGFLSDAKGLNDGTHEGGTSSHPYNYKMKGDRYTVVEIEKSFDPSRAKFPPGERDKIRAQHILESLPLGERRRLRNLADSVTLGTPMSNGVYLERLASAVQKAALLWGTDEDTLADSICSEQSCIGILMTRSADP